MVTVFKDVPIGGVRVVPCRIGGPRGIVKAFIVSAEGNTVVIDTGFSDEDGDRIARALEGIGRSPSQVDLCILTHCHGDHVGGLKRLCELSGAKVAAHRLDAAAVRERGRCPVDVEFTGGETLPLCGGLDILHLPGHSPGSIGVYFGAARSLFAGDVVFSAGEHLMPSPGYLSADPDQAVRSATGLVSSGLAIENLFVGHGDDVYGTAMDNLRRMSVTRRTF